MKKLLLVVSLTVCCVQGAFSQLISLGVETGSGSTNVLLSTSTTTNRYSRTISIYTAAEILAAGGVAGPFNSLWWKKGGTGEYQFGDATLNVYIKNTTNSLWSTVPTWDAEVNGATQVFGSSTYSIPTGTGFKQVVFNNSFTWDGVSNIEVLVDWYRPSSLSADITWARSTNTSTNASRVGTSLAGIATFLTNSNRPLLQLQIGPPLPLTLVSFGAYLKNGSTHLSWNTQSENNTDYFEIQVSKDGIGFTECGRVGASGNSSMPQAYAYVHTSAFYAVQAYAYYRLKMVDKDGRFTYSAIVKVALRKSEFKISVYPNPVKGVLALSVMQNDAEKVSYTLATMDGRVLAQQADALTGSGVLNINALATQPAGTYLLKVWAGKEQKVLKVYRQ